eukprot:1468266-Amphidinium_carterae.1
MNLKLPTPTQYDGKSPQFNAWAEEVKSYLTVHNIYIDDLLEDSTKSQRSLQECRETQSQTTFRASMHATHNLYDMVRVTTTTTWTDGKQWTKRRRTFYNSARP